MALREELWERMNRYEELGQPLQKTTLKEQRLGLGLTQAQVAERAGITLQQYQKFESGQRELMNASFRIACRVLQALEMDVKEYFTTNE